MFKKSRYLSWRYVYSLIKFSKSIPDYIKISNSSYLGVDGKDLPLKIIKGKNSLGRTLIIYPGASPTAEQHPAMNFLGSVLANIGFDVFIPRIPPLKELNISDVNILYFQKAYEELIKRDDIKNNSISCMGVSYGGALLLKSSLSESMLHNPPHAIITYGTIYDIESSLDFILTGKLIIKGKEVKIKPHEWGVVVGFHNFLSSIDIGYDTTHIQKVLKLRIQDKHDEVDEELKKIEEPHRQLLIDVLNSIMSKEVKRIINIILKDQIHILNSISPKLWCKDVKQRVFVMHGANDNMVPYTQSVQLSKNIPNAELFISYLYEHNEIAPKRSIFFKIKELKRLVDYIRKFIKYYEN